MRNEEMVIALDDLGLWDYMNKHEQEMAADDEFTDAGYNAFVKKMRDKYYDMMLADYDKGKYEKLEVVRQLTVDSPLSNKCKNLLMRHHMTDSDAFVKMVTDNGWKSYRGLGVGTLTEIVAWAMPNANAATWIANHKYAKG